MPIEDEIKPKEESKEDLKPHIKKAENVPLGPAKIRKQYTYVSICFMYTIDKRNKTINSPRLFIFNGYKYPSII